MSVQNETSRGIDAGATHLLTVAPVYLIGSGAMIAGLAWIVAPEPWILDRGANEILLRSPFDTVLSLPGNEGLADYLKAMYSFFGLWFLSLGLLTNAFVAATGLRTRRERTILHGALGLILFAAYLLQYSYIPTTPFKWMSHGFLLMLAISHFAGRRAERK